MNRLIQRLPLCKKFPLWAAMLPHSRIFLRKVSQALLCLLCLLPACRKVPDRIEPTLNYAVQDRYLKSLPAPFPPLSTAEKNESWGQEYFIGMTFAHQLELYPAITAFKRAQILLGNSNPLREKEINYEILLCYYIGRKYSDAIEIFEQSSLNQIDPQFPACHDLLLILHDCYLQEGNTTQAWRVLSLIQQLYPEEASSIALSDALIRADFPQIEYAAEHPPTPYLQTLLSDYREQKKSVAQAQLLNTLLPGTGYLYLGQTQSAVTAFLLNGLFIAAATHFFIHDHLAAGIICTSFEMGWYFGGIFGAGLEAKYHNERLYERLATPIMHEQRLFPVLKLRYAF